MSWKLNSSILFALEAVRNKWVFKKTRHVAILPLEDRQRDNSVEYTTICLIEVFSNKKNAQIFSEHSLSIQGSCQIYCLATNYWSTYILINEESALWSQFGTIWLLFLILINDLKTPQTECIKCKCKGVRMLATI